MRNTPTTPKTIVLCAKKSISINDENHSENEERNDFPAGEPGQIMAEEKERETNCRDNSGQRRAGNFELEIRAENSTEQQQRRERRDPKRDLLEAGWFDRDDVAFESGFFVRSTIESAMPSASNGLPLIRSVASCALRVRTASFGMNDAVADFYFLVFVHERFGDVGIVTVLDRGATDKRRPIRNRLLLRGGRKIFAGRKNRRGGANCAHRRHKNVLRGDGDNRASRSGVCVDEGVSRESWFD